MWLVYVGAWAFVGALSWVTTPVYLIREVGMSPLQLVLAGTALEMAYSVFEVPTGVVADLRGRRLSLVVAGVVMGAGMLLVGLVPQVAAVLAGMAVWGAGWTFRSGAEDAWLADETDPATMNRAYHRGAQVGRLARLLGFAAAAPLALVDLSLPVVVAGGAAVALAVLVAVAMPERGFVRPERTGGRMAHGLATVRAGAGVVRRTPVLLLVLGILLVLGAWQEGFDRLWEAHLLEDVGVPDLFGLAGVTWFSVIAAAVTILSFAVAAPLVRRWERLAPPRLARLLLGMHVLLFLGALAFALSGSWWLAVAAYLATSVVRDLTGPPFRAWLNGSITDSAHRATVLSLTSIAGSAGEWGGGPALGLVGNVYGVRAALAAGAAMLLPTVGLFGRAVRHHGVEPEVAEATASGSARPR
jgi:DHA3 family tetracycline resistance protein-like MFS transporter